MFWVLTWSDMQCFVVLTWSDMQRFVDLTWADTAVFCLAWADVTVCIHNVY
jgi:hypothetical protein